MAVIQPLGSSNSAASNNNQINDAFRQINREQIVKVFKQSDGSNGVIQGSLPGDEGYGELLYDSAGNARIVLRIKDDVPELKVAKSGFDVLTASNEHLIFNSSQNVFKIVASGTLASGALSISDPGAGNFASTIVSTQIAHGLTYIPAIIGYVLDTGTYYSMPQNIVNGGGTSVAWTNFSCSVDIQYVYANLSVTVGHTAANYAAGAYNLKYYLLQETANLS